MNWILIFKLTNLLIYSIGLEEFFDSPGGSGFNLIFCHTYVLTYVCMISPWLEKMSNVTCLDKHELRFERTR